MPGEVCSEHYFPCPKRECTLQHESLGFSDRYFVAFSFDTTLGVSIAIAFHKAAVRWAKQEASQQQPDSVTWQKTLAECGSYGNAIVCLFWC